MMMVLIRPGLRFCGLGAGEKGVEGDGLRIESGYRNHLGLGGWDYGLVVEDKGLDD